MSSLPRFSLTAYEAWASDSIVTWEKRDLQMRAIPSTTVDQPKPSRPRDLSIDTLRGLAIVLMVAGHVIGVTAATGMTVADDSPWRYGYELLADVRMPLFTALSGFVYALRPLPGIDRYANFVRGKSRRLLVPLLTVGTAFVLLQALTPGTNSDLPLSDAWKLYVFGLGHFWFLQALFLILLLIGLCDSFGLLRSQSVLMVAIAGTGALSIFVRIPDAWDIFSVSDALQLLPFFLLGYGLNVFWSDARRARWAVLAVAVSLLATRALETFHLVRIDGYASVALGVALGLTAIAGLVSFRHYLAWAPLARLGYFSFAIYLLHVFGTAPTRMLLRLLGVESEPAVFVACLLAGLSLPVLFEVTVGRINWVSWAFLGQRPYRSPAPKPAFQQRISAP